MNETKVMLIVSGAGVVIIAAACFLILGRTKETQTTPTAIAAKPAPATQQRATSATTRTVAPKAVAVAPASARVDVASPASTPVAVPAVAAAPPVKREETPQEMLDRFNAFAKDKLMPALETWDTKERAQVDALDFLATAIGNVSESTHELVNTDVKRTDSAVNPLVAVAIIRRGWSVQNKKHFVHYYGSQTLTITFAKDGADGWKPLRCLRRTDVDTGTANGQVREKPVGHEREDAITWVQDALAGKDPPTHSPTTQPRRN